MMMMMALTKWMLYDNQIKYLLIIILCTCFELLEKQMSKISVSKIPHKGQHIIIIEESHDRPNTL